MKYIAEKNPTRDCICCGILLAFRCVTFVCKTCLSVWWNRCNGIYDFWYQFFIRKFHLDKFNEMFFFSEINPVWFSFCKFKGVFGVGIFDVFFIKKIANCTKVQIADIHISIFCICHNLFLSLFASIVSISIRLQLTCQLYLLSLYHIFHFCL